MMVSAADGARVLAMAQVAEKLSRHRWAESTLGAAALYPPAQAAIRSRARKHLTATQGRKRCC